MVRRHYTGPNMHTDVKMNAWETFKANIFWLILMFIAYIASIKWMNWATNIQPQELSTALVALGAFFIIKLLSWVGMPSYVFDSVPIKKEDSDSV